jgi:hypothetical protein
MGSLLQTLLSNPGNFPLYTNSQRGIINPNNQNPRLIPFGRDIPGGGSSNQPYGIKKNYPVGIKGMINDFANTYEDVFEPNGKNEFIIRGGTLAPLRALRDALRLTNFFTDLKSPKGLLFLAKQNLLSRIGTKTESSKGLGYLGSFLNEGAYTPLSTIGQALIGFAGGHLNKQGLDPTGLLAFANINKYQEIIAKNQDAFTKPFNFSDNRLTSLYTYTIDRDLSAGNSFNGVKGYSLIPSNDILIQYGGGPGSILGIGKTTIKYATDNGGVIPINAINRLKKNTIASFKHTKLSNSDYKEFKGNVSATALQQLYLSSNFYNRYQTFTDPRDWMFPTNMSKKYVDAVTGVGTPIPNKNLLRLVERTEKTIITGNAVSDRYINRLNKKGDEADKKATKNEERRENQQKRQAVRDEKKAEKRTQKQLDQIKKWEEEDNKPPNYTRKEKKENLALFRLQNDLMPLEERLERQGYTRQQIKDAVASRNRSRKFIEDQKNRTTKKNKEAQDEANRIGRENELEMQKLLKDDQKIREKEAREAREKDKELKKKLDKINQEYLKATELSREEKKAQRKKDREALKTSRLEKKEELERLQQIQKEANQIGKNNEKELKNLLKESNQARKQQIETEAKRSKILKQNLKGIIRQTTEHSETFVFTFGANHYNYQNYNNSVYDNFKDPKDNDGLFRLTPRLDLDTYLKKNSQYHTKGGYYLNQEPLGATHAYIALGGKDRKGFYLDDYNTYGFDWKAGEHWKYTKNYYPSVYQTDEEGKPTLVPEDPFWEDLYDNRTPAQLYNYYNSTVNFTTPLGATRNSPINSTDLATLLKYQFFSDYGFFSTPPKFNGYHYRYTKDFNPSVYITNDDGTPTLIPRDDVKEYLTKRDLTHTSTPDNDDSIINGGQYILQSTYTDFQKTNSNPSVYEFTYNIDADNEIVQVVKAEVTAGTYLTGKSRHIESGLSSWKTGNRIPSSKPLNSIPKPVYDKTTNTIDSTSLITLSIGVLTGAGASSSYTFRAYIDSLDDNYSATWNKQKYSGRGENFYRYGGFDRSMNLSFTVVANNSTELSTNYTQLNSLAGSLSPSYSGQGYMMGNLHTLTIGNYVKNLYGIIEGLSYSNLADSVWEIDAGNELPKYISVSGIKFTPIHSFRPEFKKQYINM